MKSMPLQNFSDNKFFRMLECTGEKFVVDFVNSIDVSQDHIRTAKEHSFFRRLKEGLSGESASRQQAVNFTHSQAIEGAVRWLTELTGSLAQSNYALAQVNNRLSSLVSDTTTLVHYSVETREQLLSLSEQVHQKIELLEEEYHRIDKLQRAQLHIDQLFSGWNAGLYSSFSLAGRCYVVLEELRWGAFGDVIRQGEKRQVEQLLDILRHKIVVQLVQDSDCSTTVRKNVQYWIGGQTTNLHENEWKEVMNWLGDWCNQEKHPVIWSTTQEADNLPLRMPRLCTAERIAEDMIDEIFLKGSV